MFILLKRLLPAVFIMILSTSVVAGKSIVVTADCTTPKKGDVTLKCSYAVGFTGLTQNQQLEIALRIPDGVRQYVDSNLGTAASLVGSGPEKRDRHQVYKFKILKASGTIKFASVAPAENYDVKKKSYYVELAGTKFKMPSSEIDVPSREKKASLFRPVIGGGFTRLTDDFVDFQEVKDADQHIFTDNDSKFRAELMGGALFKLHAFKGGQTFDLAVNLEFADGGENVLDGIFVGLGFGITSAIELVGGYSLGRGKELSRGFQRAMGRFVEARQGNDKFPELQNIALEHGRNDENLSRQPHQQ